MPPTTEPLPLGNFSEASIDRTPESEDRLTLLISPAASAYSLEDFLLSEDSTGPADAPHRQAQPQHPLRQSCLTSLAEEIAEELRSLRGLGTFQKVFWELLGYERVAEPVPSRAFSIGIRKGIEEASLLARHNGFYVVVVRLGEGRFSFRWRNAVLSQVRARFSSALVLFSDYGWSRAALSWTEEGAAVSPRSIRLWPLPRRGRLPLAEKLAELRTYHDDDSPRGSLDLSESISRLGEGWDDAAGNCDFKEPQVDPDSLYDRLFDQWPLMPREETNRLLRALADLPPGERVGVRREEYLRLRDRLIAGHVRLCARAIKTFGLLRKCRSLAWTDLMQEGIFGLARAIDRFDRGHGAEFSTYAFPWIRQAIGRAIEANDRLIRMPAHCWRGEGRLPDWHLQLLGNILSLSTNESGVRHEIVDYRGDSAPNYLIRREFGPTLREGIEKCLRAVPARWREILERRAGLGGRTAQTLQEIADDFGLTRERVRQIEQRALEKIREMPQVGRLQEFLYEGGRP